MDSFHLSYTLLCECVEIKVTQVLELFWKLLLSSLVITVFLDFK